MVVVINGKYYIRDLGVVHQSRFKLDLDNEVRIQQGTIADIGKVIHYHFDKATHAEPPTTEADGKFYVLSP